MPFLNMITKETNDESYKRATTLHQQGTKYVFYLIKGLLHFTHFIINRLCKNSTNMQFRVVLSLQL